MKTAEVKEYLFLNDKKLTVSYKDRITGAIKDSFDNILSLVELDISDKIKIGSLDSVKNGITDQFEIAKNMIVNEFITSEELIQFEKGVTKSNKTILAWYKTIQLFIDSEKTDKTILKEIQKDVEKNIAFWKEQDLEYLENKFIFFRKRLA